MSLKKMFKYENRLYYENSLLKDLSRGLVRENKHLREVIETLKEAVAVANLNIEMLQRLLREKESENAIWKMKGRN